MSLLDVLQATQDTCRQLATKGVPDAVFSCGSRCRLVAVTVHSGRRVLDRNALLVVDRFARSEVLSDQEIFLSACDEDARVTMGFLGFRFSVFTFNSFCKVREAVR